MKIHATHLQMESRRASSPFGGGLPPSLYQKRRCASSQEDGGMPAIRGISKVVSHQQLFLLSALLTFRRGERAPLACAGEEGGGSNY